MIINKFLVFLVLYSWSADEQIARPVPIDLRCEYLSNPLGIDVKFPRFSWRIEYDDPSYFKPIGLQVILGADSSKLAQGKEILWQSEIMDSSFRITKYLGRPLQSLEKYYWKVKLIGSKKEYDSYSSIASFVTGLQENDHLKGDWISDALDFTMKPAAQFRKEISLSKEVESVYAVIAAGGLYELSINGQKIGNHRLDPMFTRYDRRNLYVVYDVTENMESGLNAIGVTLGNGWYNHQSTAVWEFDKAPWRARPKFCLDLYVSFSDGTEEIFSTSRDWKTHTGEIVFNSIYTGEHHDARLIQAGWNSVGFNDNKWSNARPVAAPSKRIASQVLHPIRNVEALVPVLVKRIDDFTYLFDFGLNISGVTKLEIKGPKRSTFRLTHSEQLDDAGRVDLSSINVHYRPTDDSDPFQTDIYILSGTGEKEEFMPKFNYKGFRYVEVKADRPVTLTAENLTAYFMHSDVPVAGVIESSNQTLNKIWDATNRSYLSNLFGYPTDCPQREKNGWTGDAHINIETALYNYDAITIYEKWMEDHLDEQLDNGTLPAIIPTNGWGYHWANGPDWTSTITLIPWNLYLFYGDTEILEICYDAMKKYVDNIGRRSNKNLTTWGLGDWVPVTYKPTIEFTSSIYYYIDADILAKIAQVLGHQTDHKYYKDLANNIKKAFNEKFLNLETGIYGAGGQTELSMPLKWQMVPETMIEMISERLAEKVIQDNKHINTGLLGSKAILDALSENGYADLAYEMATQESYPSWGWWIKNGATTLLENWDLDARKALSQNHIMFGEIGAWFYKGLGGIYPDEKQPGFRNTILKPNFVKGLDHFHASHKSVFGNIISEWKRNDKGEITYQVVIPSGSTATLTLNAAKVLESQKQLKSNDAISILVRENEQIILKLKSGSYKFHIKS